MIHFFCALRCEAICLIEHYKLSYERDSRLFNIYTNKEHSISLTVTGIGKLSACAAVVYSYTQLQCNPADVWLNVGIAGHRDHAINSIYLSNRIEDSASGLSWFPQLVIDIDMPTDNLITLDKPSTQYIDAMFDMEASGFISAASRFATAELIHSIKIISDNQKNPAEKVTEAEVKKLIEFNKNTIANIASQLELVSSQLESDIIISDDYDLILGQWHFTQYQRTKLEHILRRWHLLLPDLSPMSSINPSCKDANTALHSLLNTMDESRFSLSRDISNV